MKIIHLICHIPAFENDFLNNLEHLEILNRINVISNRSNYHCLFVTCKQHFLLNLFSQFSSDMDVCERMQRIPFKIRSERSLELHFSFPLQSIYLCCMRLDGARGRAREG